MTQVDSYKYLGGRASESDSLTQIAKELQLVHETDLAPNQKLEVLKMVIKPMMNECIASSRICAPDTQRGSQTSSSVCNNTVFCAAH
uniref:Uncharacterized protein n=1 Tax=Caenorhabditis tropicalis TaxID=1561998 RepID=A0A1I7U241_9PELO